MDLVRFVFLDHAGTACEAAFLFAAGSLLAFPAVRFNLRHITLFPMFLFRLAQRIVGAEANPRMVLSIFGFNGSAMFLYMACGFHPAIPAAIALFTGFNIAAILLLALPAESLAEEQRPPAEGWLPGRLVTALCGLAVLVLELPCFAFAMGMGIRLGEEVLAGRGSYAQGLSVRAGAYAAVILPLLLVSAICETVAIRGMGARIGQGDQTP